MKQGWKRIIATMLMILIIGGGFKDSLCFFCIDVKASEYKTADINIIEYGTYPQSRVTNEATLAEYLAGSDPTYFGNETPSSNVTLTDIAVYSITTPSRNLYFIGESFDPSGLTLKATYSDGSTKMIKSGFTCSALDTKTTGEKTIIITYEGKTTTFHVMVAKMTGIVVSSMPAKTVYNLGESFDPTGLTLEAFFVEPGTYSAPGRIFIGEGFYTYSGFNSATPGVKTITATFAGMSTTFNVTVVSTYTLTYDANGGTDAPPAQSGYGTITLSTVVPRRDGYTFTGWLIATYSYEYLTDGYGNIIVDENGNPIICVDANGMPIINTDENGNPILITTRYNAGAQFNLTQNIVAYAEWQPNNYTVKFNANGGIGAPAPQTGNGTIKLSTDQPTRTGYTFTGWLYIWVSGDGVLQEMVVSPGSRFGLTNDTTLYAQWQPNNYTVKFNGNGATSGSMSNQTFTYDAAQNLTVNAFKRAYTVTYNYNGATGGNSVSTATVAAAFNGWATSASGTKVYNDKASVKNLATSGTYNLYANWTLGSVTLPTPTKTGYSFGGWYTNSALTTSAGAAGAQYKPTNNVTLYAKWTQASLTGITVKTKPTKTTYNVGESLDQTGLTLTATYSDGSTKTISSGFTCTPTTLSASGTQTITVTYSGKTTSFTVIVIPNPNVYNLGEETYSFENYGDTDSEEGHCFGMAVTSSGYYLHLLNKSIIGGNDTTPLYSFRDTPTVRKPICHYLQIQGSAANGAERQSMVAGGSLDLNKRPDIQSDWDSCVQYVRNHAHDNTGVLNVGTWYASDGGHAVNFLYYKEVDGQPRMYIYDNNYPDMEMYYYMGSDNYVHEGPAIDNYVNRIRIIGIDLMDVEKYFPLADEYEPYRYIFANKDEIVVEGATLSYMKCDFELGKYVMYEIPNNTQEVTITPLTNNAEFQYLDNKYTFNQISDQTYGKLNVSKKNALPGDTTEFVIHNEPVKVTIHNYTPTRTEAYKTTITFMADTTNMPSNASVHWFVNGVDKGTENEFTVERATSDFNVQVKVLDRNGIILSESEIETVKINTGFFAKLVAFFRSIFGKLPKITQAYLGAEFHDR